MDKLMVISWNIILAICIGLIAFPAAKTAYLRKTLIKSCFLSLSLSHSQISNAGALSLSRSHKLAEERSPALYFCPAFVVF
jgi:hypothetical protein